MKERERDRERRGVSKRVGAIEELDRERCSRECRGMPKFQSPTHPSVLPAAAAAATTTKAAEAK